MPEFKYVVVDKEGKEQKGTMAARNKKAVIANLKAQDFYVTNVDIKKDFIKNLLTFGAVSLKEKVVVVRNLQVMHSAGLSLAESLKILAEQVTSPKLKKAFSDAQFDVESGIPLSSSLEKHKGVFSESFIKMIKVGEVSGNLDVIFKYLEDQLQKEYNLRAKLRVAMIYPLILISATVVIGILLTIFVLPQLIDVFDSFEVTLPITTRIMFGAGKIVINYWYIMLVVLAVLTGIFIKGYKTKRGRKVVAVVSNKIPVFGAFFRNINLARFNRATSSMISSGVPIVEAIQISGRSLNNPLYSAALQEVSKRVKKGVSVTKSLQDYPELFPSLITQITLVGEKTGKLESVLERMAEHYEFEVDNFTKNISQVIEPIMLIVIGIVIAVVAVSIMSPIYSLVEEI